MLVFFYGIISLYYLLAISNLEYLWIRKKVF